MDGINKQKFLAELSRLLTFMYEEDRQDALAMYSRMFDEAEDEQKLIQLLMSPTRQAVVVARAYDAKDRKLQVKSQSREDAGFKEDGATPGYTAAIEKVRADAVEKGILPAEVSADQFSFFDEVKEEPAEEPAEEAPAPEEEPSEADAEPEEIASPDEEPEIEVEIEELPEEGEAPAEEPAPEEAEGEPVEEEPAAEEPEVAAEELPEEPEAAEAPVEEFDYKRDILEEEEYPEPEKKAMLGWLIIFVFFAIPIGFVCCVALVVLAIIFLALAAAVVAAGVFAVKSLFTNFSILADILLVGGAAIGAFALGLLFLWTAIWCLFGGIPGVIRGFIELGRSWCYKEVAAE